MLPLFINWIIFASKAAQDELLKNPNISIIWNSQIKEILGENFVNGVLIENVKTKETQEIETDGLFVYIGMEPKTDFLEGKVGINEYGYITTEKICRQTFQVFLQ